MQNKKLIYIVAAVVLLGIAWFAFKNGGYGNQGASVVTSQNGASAVTLKDLLARGGTQICTFSNSTDGADTSGTVYIQNGALRGDFSTVANGQTVAGHMIVKDNESYFWTDLVPQGFKVSFDAMSSTGTPGAQGEIDANLPMQYNCKEWSADSSVFVLPSNVTFSAVGGQ